MEYIAPFLNSLSFMDNPSPRLCRGFFCVTPPLPTFETPTQATFNKIIGVSAGALRSLPDQGQAPNNRIFWPAGHCTLCTSSTATAVPLRLFTHQKTAGIMAPLKLKATSFQLARLIGSPFQTDRDSGSAVLR